MPNDEVRLEVPATPEFLRLARVTATGLASRLGFTYDEVEDLRLAIDELCFTVIGHGVDGSLEVLYQVVEDGLDIQGTVTGSQEAPKLTEFAEQILQALVDDHEVGEAEGGRARFRLRKRHATSTGVVTST